MNANTFQQQTRKTWNSAEDYERRLLNATLGMVGELGEVDKARDEDDTESFFKELGDSLYYGARAADELHILFEDIFNMDVGSVGGWSMLEGACETAELVKKRTFHGKDVSDKELGIAIAKYVQGADFLIRYEGGDTGEVMANTIAKLRERYPDGFKQGGGIR